MSANSDKREADRCAAEVELDERTAERVRFAPAALPAEVSRTLMKSLADKLELEAMIYARGIVHAVEESIDALRAGRYEGAIFGMRDIEVAAARFNDSVNRAGGPVDKAIGSLDPSYSDACMPARDECQIQRAMAAYQGDAPLAALEVMLSLHKACPTCHDAEAIKRVIAERKSKK